MQPRVPHLIVVGAGISGLSAAFYAQRWAREHQRKVKVTLLEAASRVGGVMSSSRRDDGFLLEHGADSFITNKPAIIQLCRDLGCESELIGTNPVHRRAFIVRAGKLVPIPEGFYLLSPTSLKSLAFNPLLSTSGRIRAALELFIAPEYRRDESLESFVRRRFGDEVFVRLAQPLVGGIYTSDPARLSLRATFPDFLNIEHELGSVFRGMLAKRRVQRRATTAQSGESKASGARYGLFASLREGLGDLPQRVASALDAGTVRLKSPVAAISRRSEGGWNVELSEGDELQADALVLALPTHQSARLLRESTPRLAHGLGRIEYASAMIVNIAYSREQVRHPLNGMGFVVPHAEGRDVLACTFSSVKFEGRAPEGRVLFRVFLGGALRPDLLELDDQQVIPLVRRELGSLVGAQGEPLFFHIDRWRNAMAQYHVGHVDRVAQLERLAREVPDLALAGNGFDGVGIPDCIRRARVASERLLASL